MIVLIFLRPLSFLSLSHDRHFSLWQSNKVILTLQGLIKPDVPPTRARQCGHVHQPASGL